MRRVIKTSLLEKQRRRRKASRERLKWRHDMLVQFAKVVISAGIRTDLMTPEQMADYRRLRSHVVKNHKGLLPEKC